VVTLHSLRADTEHPGYLNSGLRSGLFTTLCNDAAVLARLQAIATASPILRLFRHLSVFRLKHVPIYWTEDRGKTGSGERQVGACSFAVKPALRLWALLVALAEQMLGAVLGWGRRYVPREWRRLWWVWSI